MYPEFSWENCFGNPCVIQKYIFYHVYTVRSEKYFCKKSKGSYRTRLLFPVRVMPFQIVEGTEPSRLLSSSDLQNKSVKYLRRIKHKKLHNSPQNFYICTVISKCIFLETNTNCDGIDLDKMSLNLNPIMSRLQGEVILSTSLNKIHQIHKFEYKIIWTIYNENQIHMQSKLFCSLFRKLHLQYLKIGKPWEVLRDSSIEHVVRQITVI